MELHLYVLALNRFSWSRVTSSRRCSNSANVWQQGPAARRRRHCTLLAQHLLGPAPHSCWRCCCACVQVPMLPKLRQRSPDYREQLSHFSNHWHDEVS
jgi:hypothetical protein